MAFFKSTVGLYIGPKTVQLAQLQGLAGRVQLTNFIHVDVEAGSSGNKDEAILAALRKAINKSNIDTRRVNTVLMPA